MSIHATTWINLKELLSFKKKKVQKITCCMITFVGYSRKGKTQEIEIRWVSASSWGLG